MIWQKLQNDNENIEEVLKNLNVGENTDIENGSKFSDGEILLLKYSHKDFMTIHMNRIGFKGKSESFDEPVLTVYGMMMLLRWDEK